MPSPVTYALALLSRLVLVPLWWASGFMPRRMDLWVFGSWGGYRFADNSASFFRFCQGGLAGSVYLVWISRDPAIVRMLRGQGLDARLAWSPRGVLACLRAGVHLFDCFPKDTNFWLGRGAFLVNLWSGVPLKVFEREIDNPRSRYYRLFHGTRPERWFLTIMMPWHVVRPDLVIATSEETAAITCRAFDLPRDRVVVTGFPRNDVLLTAVADRPAPPLPTSAREPVFIYLPTWRDSGSTPDRAVDWSRLDELLARHRAWLFCKPHPMAAAARSHGLSRIVELPRGLDIYPLLRHTRALISDYSSIIFDYMLLGRPIVYFTPDLEEFVRGSRGLNFKPIEVAVGPVCTDCEQLLDAIGRIAAGEEVPGPCRREDVLPRLHAYVDARASERVLAEVQRRCLATAARDRPDGIADRKRVSEG